MKCVKHAKQLRALGEEAPSTFNFPWISQTSSALKCGHPTSTCDICPIPLLASAQGSTHYASYGLTLKSQQPDAPRAAVSQEQGLETSCWGSPTVMGDLVTPDRCA